MDMNNYDNSQCVGFVEPKSNRGTRNTMHIEKIEGCASMKYEESVDDVLVIWCATRQQGDTTVVGWYKQATVYRDLQWWIFEHDDGEEEERCFNVNADASNCVLLPEWERNRYQWSVPSARRTRSFGFGQAMTWYPTQQEAQPFLARLIDSIEKYNGENWLDTYPQYSE